MTDFYEFEYWLDDGDVYVALGGRTFQVYTEFSTDGYKGRPQCYFRVSESRHRRLSLDEAINLAEELLIRQVEKDEKIAPE
jgi:hypothetical protein